MDRTKLEQAVKAMDEEYKKSVPEETIFKKTINKIMTGLGAISCEQVENDRNHKSKELELNRRKNNLLASIDILNGREGYFRCEQHMLNPPESGFTSFEEIVDLLQMDFVTVSINPLIPYLGSYVYKIDDKGMMTLSASKIDSSDSTKVGSNN